MKRKFLSIVTFLVALLLVISMIACQPQTEQPSDGTGTGEGKGTETEVGTETEEISGYVDGIDYDGYEFRILTAAEDQEFIFCDEQSSALMPSAVYTANLEVSEKYDVTLSVITVTSAQDSSAVENLVLSEVDAFDITHMHDCTTGALSLSGYFEDIYSIPGMDPTNPWWPQFTVDSLTLNGKMYFVSNYASYSPTRSTILFTFNRQLLASFQGMDNPQDLVRKDEWTFDKLIEITSAAYADVNHNNEVDENDQFGIATGNALYGWLEGFGFEMYQKVSNNSAELGFYSDNEKVINFLEKAYDWCFGPSDDAIALEFHKDWDWGLNTFAAGRALFTARPVGDVLAYVLSTNIDYGFVPFPKLDETQKDYITSCNGNPIAVPNNLTNLERTGTILEAMSYAGYKHIMPAYIETALKDRYSDDDNREMIEIAFQNRVLSFSYLYSTSGSGAQLRLINDTFGLKNNAFASYLEQYSTTDSRVMKAISDLYS